MIDRTPAIIACMRDMVAERCDKASYNNENANLFASLDALTIAVDNSKVFNLWPVTGTDEMHAAAMIRIVDGRLPRCVADDAHARPVAGAVARCLSEVACALFVQGVDGNAAEWLLSAAGRLIGLPDESAEMTELRMKAQQLDAIMARVEQVDIEREHAGTRSTLLASIVDKVSEALGMPHGKRPHPFDPGAAHDLAANIKTLRLDLASTTEQRDEALRQLAELRREIR